MASSNLLANCIIFLQNDGFLQPKEADYEGLPDGVKREEIWYKEGPAGTRAVALQTPASQQEAVLMYRVLYSAPDRGDPNGSWSMGRRPILILEESTFPAELARALG